MQIYLDIDGVMVSANSWKRPEMLNDGFPRFNIRAVNALNSIVNTTGANIVLTTSHKTTYSIAEWEKIFKERNLNFNQISRLPENKNHLNRKEELLNHFDKHGLHGNFVIIDDDKSLNGLPTNLKDRLIQTSSGIGLTDELAKMAIAKLSEVHLTSA
ncbi:HAD domain-containing protein [Psychroflexus planctonicus]|uniref:Uncharacterized protein n=1 Tax=Psychroflexus planctonicus TaxID=1526575 RepID=A0ABQ1SJK0_9FLAO|nr:HAD domain-containing protein [Psychroflexus planctonicus]GGE41870.1 hypothetical protein GCM10010832_22390 [Psychroflexus planctonicus]